MTRVVRPAMNGASDVHHVALGLDVEVGRGLVEDQDRGVLDDRPGDRQPLTLAAAAAARRSRRRASRSRAGSVVDERRGSGAWRQAASIRSSVTSASATARLSRIVALNRWTSWRHDAEQPPDVVGADRRGVAAADPDLALVVVPEAQQEVDERRLARRRSARRSRGSSPDGTRQVEPVEDQRLVRRRSGSGGRGSRCRGRSRAGRAVASGGGSTDRGRRIGQLEQPLAPRPRWRPAARTPGRAAPMTSKLATRDERQERRGRRRRAARRRRARRRSPGRSRRPGRRAWPPARPPAPRTSASSVASPGRARAPERQHPLAMAAARSSATRSAMPRDLVDERGAQLGPRVAIERRGRAPRQPPRGERQDDPGERRGTRPAPAPRIGSKAPSRRPANAVTSTATTGGTTTRT